MKARRLLAGLTVALLGTPPAAGQEPAPCASLDAGVWVELAGARYQLASGVRLPARTGFRIVGTPAGVRPAIVELRRSAGADWERLPTSVTEDGCGWTAAVPPLAPLADVELRVRSFAPLTDGQRRLVRETLVRMVVAVAEFFDRGLVPEEVTEAEQRAILRQLLTERFPPASTLSAFSLGAADDTLGLGAALVELAATQLSVAGVLDQYATRLQGLRAVLQDQQQTLQLEPEQRRHVQRLREALGEAFLAAGPGQSSEPVHPLFLAAPPILPLSPVARGALIALSQRVRGADAAAAREDVSRIQYLGVGLEERLPQVFARLAVVLSSTYQARGSSVSVPVSDLERFGTVDFVAGQLLRGERTNLGFLTLSFYPTGAAARTPEDAWSESRLTVSLGYSVTGEDSQGRDYLLAGLTLRLSRVASLTVGLVSPARGGDFECCFVGAAGDLSGLPFLGNLFVKGSGNGH